MNIPPTLIKRHSDMPHFRPTSARAEFGATFRAFGGQNPISPPKNTHIGLHIETGTRILPYTPFSNPCHLLFLHTSPHFLVTSQPWWKLLLSPSLSPCPLSPPIARLFRLEAMASVMSATTAAVAAAVAVTKTKMTRAAMLMEWIKQPKRGE